DGGLAERQIRLLCIYARRVLHCFCEHVIAVFAKRQKEIRCKRWDRLLPIDFCDMEEDRGKSDPFGITPEGICVCLTTAFDADHHPRYLTGKGGIVPAFRNEVPAVAFCRIIKIKAKQTLRGACGLRKKFTLRVVNET